MKIPSEGLKSCTEIIATIKKNRALVSDIIPDLVKNLFVPRIINCVKEHYSKDEFEDLKDSKTGTTILMLAAEAGQIDLVMYLLEEIGVSQFQSDNFDNTVLDYAIRRRKYVVIRYLVNESYLMTLWQPQANFQITYSKNSPLLFFKFPDDPNLRVTYKSYVNESLEWMGLWLKKSAEIECSKLSLKHLHNIAAASKLLDMSHETEEFSHQCKQELALRKACENNINSKEMNNHLEGQEEALLKAIRGQLKKDSRRRSMYYLKELIGDKNNFKIKSDAEKLLAFLDSEDSDPYKIPKVAEKYFYQSFKSKIVHFNKAIRYIKNFRQSLNDTTHGHLKQKLRETKHFYKKVIERYKTCKTLEEASNLLNKKQRVQILGTNLKYHYITLEAWEKLKTKKETQQGGHVVNIVGDVVYKICPYAPGVEFMVGSLNKILFGFGSSSSTLLKFIDNEGAHWPVLASKRIDGVGLDFILENHPECLGQIRGYNYSAMFISSLLINPRDGKPDNFIANVYKDSNDTIIKIDIIGIDNDMSFYSPFFRDEGRNHISVNVRNVLYFFPQIDDEIDSEFKRMLLEINPTIIVLTWIEELIDKNKEYVQLMKDGVFLSEEYTGIESMEYKLNYGQYSHFKLFDYNIDIEGHLPGLQLPVKVKKNTIIDLHTRLIKIQKSLRTNMKVTHRDIFEAILPKLAQTYEMIYSKIAAKNTKQSKNGEVKIGKLIKDSVSSFYKMQKKCSASLPSMTMKDVTEDDLPSSISVSQFATAENVELLRNESIEVETSHIIGSIVLSDHTDRDESSILDVANRHLKDIAHLNLQLLRSDKCEKLYNLLRNRNLKSLTKLSVSFNSSISDRWANKILTLLIEHCTDIELDCAQITLSQWHKFIFANFDTLIKRNFNATLCVFKRNDQEVVLDIFSLIKAPFNLACVAIEYGISDSSIWSLLLKSLCMKRREKNEGINGRLKRSMKGGSLLHYAVLHSNIIAADHLLRSKIEVSSDNNDMTPLDVALNFEIYTEEIVSIITLLVKNNIGHNNPEKFYQFRSKFQGTTDATFIDEPESYPKLPNRHFHEQAPERPHSFSSFK